MRFNTFDQVAEWYNNTPPVRGKNNEGKDIRPIDARRYKWKRIKKYDENTYALMDGYFDMVGQEKEQYARDMAAILWSRRDGKEYIRIRNLPVGYTNFARADFHMAYLPANMIYRQHQSGRHEVEVKTSDMHGWTTYELPKTTYKWDWSTNTTVTEDDGMLLEFERDGDKWVRVSAPMVVPSTRIDKDTKKQMKPSIEAFYEQVQVLAPMLNAGESWRIRDEYANAIVEYLRERNVEVYSYWLANKVEGIPANVTREIFTDEQHELRIPLIALVACRVGLYRVMRGTEDIKVMRATYTRLVNKILALNTTKEI